MEPISGDALRGHLDALILSALERGSAHGFEVWQRLEAAGSGALKLREGSLYPALYRIEAAGYVKSAWEDGVSERRGPRRRVYRLTPKGTRRLADARSEWQHFTAVIGGILGAPA
ncbi:helix-turn-helix transcriptional regulator [Fimbriiglobus ruber]|uniref:Transcriptional regulator, PadR family n=1 Tax=Fimbriiglobus ruber TaxID=1908690 RepID=A0A225DBK4_9BACT|nr:helix-turn-helix transcriptional regulator [Fimbriiglobus ruber]OWK34529.1 Transcriptional regulator, PadR family [Fimbriiglobus ruber]